MTLPMNSLCHKTAALIRKSHCPFSNLYTLDYQQTKLLLKCNKRYAEDWFHSCILQPCSSLTKRNSCKMEHIASSAGGTGGVFCALVRCCKFVWKPRMRSRMLGWAGHDTSAHYRSSRRWSMVQLHQPAHTGRRGGDVLSFQA